jgi:hypothetical protein
MAKESPKAQILGGEAATLGQRVEDNAFHWQHFCAQPLDGAMQAPCRLQKVTSLHNFVVAELDKELARRGRTEG